MRGSSRTSRDPLHGEAALLGDLLVGRLAAEPRSSVRSARETRCWRSTTWTGRRIERAWLASAALDGLLDPERRVGRELQPAAPVELLDGADQAQDALLDQVEQRELALALVPLGDRDHEAQVRVDHPLLRLGVAGLDALGQLALLLAGQQRVAADLVEEDLHRVGRRLGELAVGGAGRRHADARAVVEHVDAALGQVRVQLGHLVVVEAGVGRHLAELADVDAALLLAGRDQRLQLGAVPETVRARARPLRVLITPPDSLVLVAVAYPARPPLTRSGTPRPRPRPPGGAPAARPATSSSSEV